MQLNLNDYNDETKSFAKAIVSFLSEKMGQIPETFKFSLDILLTNYQVWSEARLDVLHRGALIEVNGEVKKNPSYKILNDAQIFLNNQLKSWSLDLKSLKQLDSFSGSNQTDLMQILNDLEND